MARSMSAGEGLLRICSLLPAPQINSTHVPSGGAVYHYPQFHGHFLGVSRKPTVAPMARRPEEPAGAFIRGGALDSPQARRTSPSPVSGAARRSAISGKRSSRTNGAISHMALRVARGLLRLWLVLSVL